MFVFTVILAGVTGGLFGCLIGMTVITVRDVIRLERELTDERRRARLHELDARNWRKAAERWQARAGFHQRIHQLERQILGIEPRERVGAEGLRLVDGGEG